MKHLYREKYGVLASHAAATPRWGQSFAGSEADFVVRCNC